MSPRLTAADVTARMLPPSLTVHVPGLNTFLRLFMPKRQWRTTAAMSALDGVIPDSTMEIIGRLGHAAPARKAPRAVSRHILQFLRASR